PYLRPLHDALHDMLPSEEIQKHTERGIIEIAPLAYMRGRTLNHAFIILDEAQNSTTEQMFMFLTRLGISSKDVITGDEWEVYVRDRQKTRRVNRGLLRRTVASVLVRELGRKEFVVGIYLVGETNMTELNEEHLGHRGSTDVITFDYGESSQAGLLAGEIFIC